MRYKIGKFLLLVGIVFNVSAEKINLSGKVSNLAGKPIAKAIVTLIKQGLKDTTDSNGLFAIVKDEVSVLPYLRPSTNRISINRDYLMLSLMTPSKVRIEIFDVSGKFLKREILQTAEAGFYNYNIGEYSTKSKLLLIKVGIGTYETTIRYIPLNNKNSVIDVKYIKNNLLKENKLSKIMAIDDTLEVKATSYQTKKIAITSYDNQGLNITLDSIGSNGKNPPCPSAGCGKELSDLKSGTYTITSAGLSRKYTIEIPANYNKNKPYILIFGMHMMGGNMKTVVDNNYYELKTYAERDKVEAIFVAPEGNTDNTPWRVNDNKDHIFFSDMLKLFKEKLCVDTSRIFCCGFSYGAMVTYSLSLAFQKQLRAVACYAPANWNIWLPTNTHEPIAYYQTTGTDDNLCKWINSDPQKQGGKYCLLTHLEDNVCKIPSTIPTANTNGKHITTEFEGCKEGYPVLFGSFKGGHSMDEKDSGSNINWIAKETWEFFMRF